MKLTVNLKDNSYDISICRGALNRLSQYIPSHHKMLIVSDDNIPNEYVELVKSSFPHALIYRFPHGEENKSFDTYSKILSFLVDNEFSRKDAVIALGGGVTSDLAGFVASSYMRGIAFYIIPTTLLSMADASTGGKVGINYQGIKNVMGAFYQPKAVVIDPLTLKTLDERLINEGIAEIIKMAAIYNEELFEKLEKCVDFEANIEEILYEALSIKKDVVEKDEKESNLRMILNYGHTIGHAIEAKNKGKYYHGECVAMGMTYFINEVDKPRLINLLEKYHLPTLDTDDNDELIDYIRLDKKKHEDKIKICYVPKLGSYELKDLTFNELKQIMEDRKHEK